MNKIVILILTISMIACGGDKKQIDSDLLATIEKRGSIRISTDPNYAPQSFLTEKGEFVGFDVDVAREIAKRLGVEVEFVTPDWDLITAGNWSGQWDMSVGSVAVTEKRKDHLDFAQPPYYYTLAQFAATNNTGIDSIDQISGQRVCVCVSTVYEDWINHDYEKLGLPATSIFVDPPKNVTVIPLKTDNECVQSIQAGREDFAIFLSSNTIVQAAIDHGVAVHKVGDPVFAESLAIAFDKHGKIENSDLVAKVSEIISQMHADGTLGDLSKKWFDGNDLTRKPTR